MSTGRARAHIIGNLGKDPDSRYTPSGTMVSDFTVAVNNRRRQQGSEDPPPDWYRVVCFGQQAEFASEYLRKGLRVYVDGRLEIDDWVGNDGQERRTVQIVASDVMILTPREDSQGSPRREGGQGQEEDFDDLPF